MFYQRFFELAPDARPLFPTDMERQNLKLMDMIAAIVGAIENRDIFRSIFTHTGRDHARFGARPAHFAAFGEALIWGLEQQFGAALHGRAQRGLDQAVRSRAAHHDRRRNRRMIGPKLDLRIRAMAPSEISLAADWAAAEGWNPGLSDTACFAATDPHGFLIGELDGTPATTISAVNYDERFAFLGFYIVRPDLRGRGSAGGPGGPAWRMQATRHRPRRRGGAAGQLPQVRLCAGPSQHPLRRVGRAADGCRQLRNRGVAEIPFANVAADDATVFPAPRLRLLRAWIAAPGHVGRALVRDGQLAGGA